MATTVWLLPPMLVLEWTIANWGDSLLNGRSTCSAIWPGAPRPPVIGAAAGAAAGGGMVAGGGSAGGGAPAAAPARRPTTPGSTAGPSVRSYV